jgi:UDP-galactopyranose mutase
MNQTPDYLVVGAGPSGCIIADRMASRGRSVLLIDKRNHVGGNCHDSHDEAGILVHRYGPHYFRTNDDGLLQYLSQFTSWLPAQYIVKSKVGEIYYPLPINLTTLEMFFKQEFTEETARAFVAERCEPITHPANAEEYVLANMGRELYEAFYRPYTLKQWGRSPREIDVAVCGRVPIRFNRDFRYVTHKHQCMPDAGYTAMFTRMVASRDIELQLNTDYAAIKEYCKPKIATVYTGPVDTYFGHCYGTLPWRSLRFEPRHYDKVFQQPCVQVNYPDEQPFTRSVEIKHVTGQIHPATTVIYEYPVATGEPYYPVPSQASREQYARYQELAEHETASCRVHFIGRLARYTYIDMDQAMLAALKAADTLI